MGLFLKKEYPLPSTSHHAFVEEGVSIWRALVTLKMLKFYLLIRRMVVQPIQHLPCCCNNEMCILSAGDFLGIWNMTEKLLSPSIQLVCKMLGIAHKMLQNRQGVGAEEVRGAASLFVEENARDQMVQWQNRTCYRRTTVEMSTFCHDTHRRAIYWPEYVINILMTYNVICLTRHTSMWWINFYLYFVRVGMECCSRESPVTDTRHHIRTSQSPELL